MAAQPFLADQLNNLPPAKHLLWCMQKKVKGNASFLTGGMQVWRSVICLENEKGHPLDLQVEWRLPKHTCSPHPTTDTAWPQPEANVKIPSLPLATAKLSEVHLLLFLPC